MIAENNDLLADFKGKRKREKKEMLDKGWEDKSSNLSVEDRFRIALL